MEFNKTEWSCPWNSDQNCIQNSARGVGVCVECGGVWSSVYGYLGCGGLGGVRIQVV